ncbi:MAG: hypothetical protein ACI9P9_000151 [Patescibacteria group bacterium]|jgi:hypothetical protein
MKTTLYFLSNEREVEIPFVDIHSIYTSITTHRDTINVGYPFLPVGEGVSSLSYDSASDAFLSLNLTTNHVHSTFGDDGVCPIDSLSLIGTSSYLINTIQGSNTERQALTKHILYFENMYVLQCAILMQYESETFGNTNIDFLNPMMDEYDELRKFYDNNSTLLGILEQSRIKNISNSFMN